LADVAQQHIELLGGLLGLRRQGAATDEEQPRRDQHSAKRRHEKARFMTSLRFRRDPAVCVIDIEVILWCPSPTHCRMIVE